ncbi:MAG: gshA [Acidimicrobiales bacterium]|nr:gshA [Acidimicrobiales bacterium]
MPGPLRQLTLGQARDHIQRQCFPASGGDTVGLETEWLVVPDDDFTAPAPFPRLQAAVAMAEPFPSASRVTYEPGGQLELSGPPAPTVGEACIGMAVDVAAAERAIRPARLSLLGEGCDPHRAGRRVLHTPRYAAMEAFFRTDGVEGERMMSSTASVQVNVGLGGEGTANERWVLAHALGPTLVATFANSPMYARRATGWKSSRLATWWAIDPTRTAPVGVSGGVGACSTFALDARVMFIRQSSALYHPMQERLSFGRWIVEGHELGHPTIEDLDYHLTTLFPPVRARGWLELRYLDALPDPWWRVASTVVATLLLDDEAAAAAFRATEGTEDLWLDAARWGLQHPALAAAATECVTAAMDAAERVGADRASRQAMASYYDRYVARGRCPADDRLFEGARA